MKTTDTKPISLWKVLLILVMTVMVTMSFSSFNASAAAKPGQPKLVSAKVSGNDKVVVKWNKTQNAKTYKIFYKTGNGKWKCIAQVKSNVTSYTHTSSSTLPIKVGVKYTYTVKAVNEIGNGDYDKTGKSVTLSKPGQPKLVSAAVSGTDKVIVKWNRTSNAEKYHIYYKTGSGSWKYIASVGSSKTSYTHKSTSKLPLKAGTKYSYTVKAENALGAGTYNKTGKSVGSVKYFV